jgi:PAS domain S-box-containing protein
MRDREIAARADDATSAEAKHLHLLVELLPTAVALFDRDMRYLAVSRRWADDYLGGARDVVGKGHYELFPACPERWRRDHRRGLAGERVTCAEDGWEAPDGSVIWVSYEVRPWYEAPGAIGGIMILTEDITERKRAEAQARVYAARLEVATTAARLAVFSQDRELRYTWIHNPALGRTAEEVIGRRDSELFERPQDAAVVEGLKRRVLATAEPARAEVTIHHAGVPRQFELNIAPQVDDRGEVEGVICAAVETTELRAAQAEVASQISELQSIYDTAPIGLCLIDRELRFRRINRRLADINGVPAVEHLGRAVREIVPTLADDAERAIREVLASGRPLSGIELQGETSAAPGEKRTWLEHFVPVMSAAGEVNGVSVVVEDVTQQRAAEALLREANARKDAFLATLSHELRNPLAPIRNAAAILESQGADAARVAWAVGVIQRQVRTMAVLLDDLLDVARITQGKLRLRKSAVSLQSVVDAAVEAAEQPVRAKGHALTVELPPGGVTLEADALRLTQVLTNLLVNAAKFTDAGGRIRLQCAVEGRDVCIRVSDNGIGIAPVNLARLFDMYSQLESPDERGEGGLGIGLALARGLVALHGGALTASSAGLGCGSEFRVDLWGCVRDAEAPVRPTAAPGAQETVRARVLVADDNRDAADSTALLLQSQGFEVRVAYGGQEALQAALEYRPSIAVLDLGMPDLSGEEVARRLRQQAWGAGTLLVALTGWGQEAQKARALSAGFDVHLVKPVEPGRLAAVLTGGKPGAGPSPFV